MDKLIITAALTGGDLVSKVATKYVPCTTEEIVDEVVKCRKAGASIVHLHAKDPDTGLPASDPNPILKEYVERIKESEASDIIINITTGGGRFAEPEVIEEWMKERTTFGQEMDSLNMGSVNLWATPRGMEGIEQEFVFSNTLGTIERWAGYMYNNGVKPELEVYDTAQIQTALRFLEQGKLKSPLHFQLVMFDGNSCMTPEPETMVYCVRRLPENSTWSVCAPGRSEMEMGAIAVIMGGHVRVGMEDNIYLEKGVLAKSNAELVAKIARISKELGREIATPDEARKILSIKKRG
jgi:3-keto-5-aminohexanoate cleavage enzyme